MDDVARARLLNEAKRDRLSREETNDAPYEGAWTFQMLRALDRVCPVCDATPRESLDVGGPSDIKNWIWLNGRFVHEPC